MVDFISKIQIGQIVWLGAKGPQWIESSVMVFGCPVIIKRNTMNDKMQPWRASAFTERTV